MDTNHQHSGALGSPGPYDHIDVGWIEQRLKEKAGARKSKLAGYFEGYMEFYEEPPPLSRSPTPEIQEQGAWHAGGTAFEQSSRRRPGNTDNAPLPRRRGTMGSDSDTTAELQPRRKRRCVTPVSRPELRRNHTTRTVSRGQRLSNSNIGSGRPLNAHRMQTRSKSRRTAGTRYSGISKSRSQRRKGS